MSGGEKEGGVAIGFGSEGGAGSSGGSTGERGRRVGAAWTRADGPLGVGATGGRGRRRCRGWGPCVIERKGVGMAVGPVPAAS